MAAKYTTAPSSTLPQAPALTQMLAVYHSYRGYLSEAEALAYINQLFDDVSAVPFTGNNLLTIMWAVMAIEHYGSISRENAIIKAERLLASVEAVQA